MEGGRDVATSRLTKTDYGTLPLKYVIAILPFGIFLNLWHNHKSAAMSVGLGLGVICSHLIPPRPPIRVTLICIPIAVILGALIARLNNWPR
jgi:hypothetical protein